MKALWVSSVFLAFTPSVFAASVHTHNMQVASPKEAPFGFDIDVTLSARAKRLLQQKKEVIKVYADYSGYPTLRYNKDAQANGRIDVSKGEEIVVLPCSGGHVHISGAKIDSEELKKTIGPLIVNVNVVSGRHYQPINILACDFIYGQLPQVQKQSPLPVYCSLISENRNWNVKQLPYSSAQALP